MMLLVSTCRIKLHEREFVQPIAEIIRDHAEYVIKHYKEKIDPKKYSHIIICGTALKDNDYLDNLDRFSWISTANRPVLGICSGMQAIGLNFGAKLIETDEIGIIEISTTKENRLFKGTFEAYSLHSNSLAGLDRFEVLAESDNCVEAFSYNNFYGILFHPEARNKAIIKRFIEL